MAYEKKLRHKEAMKKLAARKQATRVRNKVKKKNTQLKHLYRGESKADSLKRPSKRMKKGRRRSW